MWASRALGSDTRGCADRAGREMHLSGRYAAGLGSRAPEPSRITNTLRRARLPTSPRPAITATGSPGGTARATRVNGGKTRLSRVIVSGRTID